MIGRAGRAGHGVRTVSLMMGAVLTMAGLSGCASSGSAPASPRSAASSAPSRVAVGATSGGAGSTAGGGSTGGGSTGGASTGGGSGVDVCAVLSASKAGAIVGTTFTATKSRGYAGVVSVCEYTGGTDLLQVTVVARFGENSLKEDVAALTGVGHPPTKITGVGDDAFAEPNPNGNAGAVGAAATASYGAVFGDTYIKVGGMWVTPDQGRQIVELLHAAQ